MTTKLNMLQAIDRKLSGVIATTDRKAQLIRKINATLDHAVKSMDGWITLNGNSGEDESGGSHVFVGKGGQIEKGASGLKGKKLSDLKGTKKFTKYETNAEQASHEPKNNHNRGSFVPKSEQSQQVKNAEPLTKDQKKVMHWNNAARVEKTIEGKRDQAKFKKFVNSASKKFGDENILGVRKNGVVEVDPNDGTDNAQLWAYSNDNDRFYHMEDSDIKKTDTQIGKQLSTKNESAEPNNNLHPLKDHLGNESFDKLHSGQPVGFEFDDLKTGNPVQATVTRHMDYGIPSYKLKGNGIEQDISEKQLIDMFERGEYRTEPKQPDHDSKNIKENINFTWKINGVTKDATASSYQPHKGFKIVQLHNYSASNPKTKVAILDKNNNFVSYKSGKGTKEAIENAKSLIDSGNAEHNETNLSDINAEVKNSNYYDEKKTIQAREMLKKMSGVSPDWKAKNEEKKKEWAKQEAERVKEFNKGREQPAPEAKPMPELKANETMPEASHPKNIAQEFLKNHKIKEESKNADYDLKEKANALIGRYESHLGANVSEKELTDHWKNQEKISRDQLAKAKLKTKFEKENGNAVSVLRAKDKENEYLREAQASKAKAEAIKHVDLFKPKPSEQVTNKS